MINSRRKIDFILCMLTCTLLTPIASSAFSVTNDTDYTLNINVYNNAWWFSHNYIIPPKTQNHEYTKGIGENDYLTFNVSVNKEITLPTINDRWEIYDIGKTKLRFFKGSDKLIHCTVNSIPLW